MTRREILVRLHRYVGLAIALFLIVSGLTGSMIVFREELDAWLNPDLFRSASIGDPLPPSEVAARVEASDHRIRVAFLPLPHAPGESLALRVEPRIDPSSRRRYVVDYDQVFVDPVTGAILGKRQFGACCLARQHLMPFLYTLHYTLMMPGRWGIWLMGTIAVLWFVDCFVGLALTVPRARPRFAAWGRAWRIKPGAGSFRTTFDLHRAGGLWFWMILALIALSGVALNLSDEVFRPLVSTFSTLKPSPKEQGRPRLRVSPVEPALGFEDAIARAKEEIASRNWPMQPFDAYYVRPYGVYIVSVAVPGGDHEQGLGHPHLYFDDQDGRLLRADVPGEGSAGDIFVQLQYPVHSGHIAGLAGRIVICISGMAVAVLSVTGVVIWWKKRRARLARPLRS